MSTFSTLRKAVVVETPQGLPDAPKQLDVLHVESGFRMAPETLYRVDAVMGKRRT